MKNLQTMKHSVQKGFTLIELMIVVAIIGILAALAIPAYQDYTIKSRVGEGASLTGAFKTAVEVYWSENGTLNGIEEANLGGASLGLSSVAGEYVSDISFGTGPILVVQLRSGTNKLGGLASADEGADGGCFVYSPTRPANTGGNLRWEVLADDGTCDDVPAKYRPKT
jgi:type IV pilus assembly protein PilA